MALLAALATALLSGCLIHGNLPDASRLWPTRSAPRADEGTPTVSVGIGSIVSDVDGTTESFGLYQYLLANPIQVRGANVVVELVDTPSEAMYAVTGRVRGKIGYHIDVKHKAAVVGGYTTASAGGSVMLIGLLLSSDTRDESNARSNVILSGEILVAAGLFVMTAGLLDASANGYQWDERAEVTFRRRGQRIDDVKIHANAGRYSDGDLAGVHDTTLAPVWAAIRLRLVSRIEADLSEGRS